MSPSEEYKPFWIAVQEKIYMSKILIEFLKVHPEAMYEDLLSKIQVRFDIKGIQGEKIINP